MITLRLTFKNRFFLLLLHLVNFPFLKQKLTLEVVFVPVSVL